MIVIEDVLVSEELMQEHFVCNLKSCKGACCWEGDYGAPVNQDEITKINENLDQIRPYLSPKSNEILNEIGATVYYDNADLVGTSLHDDGPCTFLVFDELGIAQCGIERAWKDGKSNFRKPISCHLYPLRVSENEGLGFEAWNYERWDICSAACELGDKLKVPVYQFLKDAIIRYKGEQFYDQLAAAANREKE